ncbi:alpha-ketoglutarate-dependent dioxygenase, partial [Morganella morganii]
MSDLFAHDEPLAVAPDAYLLKGFLSDEDEMLLAEIRRLTAISPFRHMQTPGGYRMSAAMSSCGTCGWISDAKGYRYSPTD